MFNVNSLIAFLLGVCVVLTAFDFYGVHLRTLFEKHSACEERAEGNNCYISLEYLSVKDHE